MEEGGNCSTDFKDRTDGGDQTCPRMLDLYKDPVLISNITSNGSRLGEDMAVSVQFSGEESAVTWEVDGEPLPERYRLIDDNRTLIIPSVQRDDADRRFRVRITNPVSEEIREYRPINDIMFIRMLEAEDSGSVNGRVRVPLVAAALPVGLVIIIYIVYQNFMGKKGCEEQWCPRRCTTTQRTMCSPHLEWSRT